MRSARAAPPLLAPLCGALLCAFLAAPARAQPDAPVAPSASPVDGAGGERTELVLWHAYRAAEADAIDRLVAALNADTASPYSVRVLAVPFDAYLDKITGAIPRGKGPDVFIAAHDTIGDWAEARTIAPLDDVLTPARIASLEDGLVPGVLYTSSKDGAHAWAVPLAFKSIALWRHTESVKDAPLTLDDLERAAVAATDKAAGTYGLVYDDKGLYHHAPFLFGFGGALFDEHGKPSLAAPGNVESVRYVMALAKRAMPSELNVALATSLFADKKAAMMIAGPWTLGDLEDLSGVAVSALPKTPKGPMRPLLSVEAAFLSGKTAEDPKRRALAVQLIDALATVDAAAVRLNVGKQPVAQRAAWQRLDEHAAHAALLRGFHDQLRATVPTPNTPVMKSLWSPFDMALGASIGQDLDPAQTLAEAQQKVEGLVAAIESGPPPASRGEAVALIALVVGVLVSLAAFGVVRYGGRRLIVDIAASGVAYLYSAPAMIGMALLVLVPFACGIGMGFFEHAWGEYTFVGFLNFKKIITGSDTTFFRTLGMTLVWTASNVFLHVVIGVFLALVLSQARLRFRAVYRVLFIVPWAVPSYITALIWKGMFHPEYGAVNAVLGTTGFSWMSHTWSAFAANLATNVWLGFPFMMVIALGGLTAIPADLYEAAALDGAGPVRRFFTITLPLLWPTLAPAIVLGSVWTFNMFNVIYLVSGGAPENKTDILITEAFRWAFERGQGGAFGYAAAYSTLVFLLLVAYTTAANRVARAVQEARA